MKKVNEANYVNDAYKKIIKYFNNDYRGSEVNTYLDYYANLNRKMVDEIKNNIPDEVALMKLISSSYDFLCSTIYEQDLDDVLVSELEFAVYAKRIYEMFKASGIENEFHASLIKILSSTIAHAMVYDLNVTLELLELEVKVIQLDSKSKTKNNVINNYFKGKSKIKDLAICK